MPDEKETPTTLNTLKRPLTAEEEIDFNAYVECWGLIREAMEALANKCGREIVVQVNIGSLGMINLFKPRN